MRSEDAHRPPSAAWLIGVIGALILAALGWIATAEVEHTARFAARLEPLEPDRIVHAGVAGTLRLGSGALPAEVRAGERLGEIEAAGVLAGLAELRAEADAARARLIRLGAEAARTAEAAERDRLAEADLAQHRHALAALRARAAAAAEGLAIVSAEMAAQTPLVAAGLAAGRSLEPYRRAEAEQRGEAAALGAEIARAEAALEAARARRDSAAETRRAVILAELAEAEAALARLEARRPALMALMAAAEIRSPVAGRLELLERVETGAAVAAGQPILRVRPQGTELRLRALIDPGQAAGLRPGLPVRLRLSGPGEDRGRGGRIIAIEPAAQDDGAMLFAVEIAADPPLGASADLRAGQTAEVAVVTGRQRVAAYLLGPLAGAGGLGL
ncbi:MAG: HlyD family efflux transporter periplasmic adaptor subunit [Gemmobacter sp.]